MSARRKSETRKMSAQVLVRLDDRLDYRLARHAERLGVSAAEVVRLVLDDALPRYRRPTADPQLPLDTDR